MDRILITGTAGYLGANLAHYFLQNTNATIFGIDNFSSSDFSSISNLLKSDRFIFIEKSLNQGLDMTVDYIFHACGCDDIEKINKNCYEYIQEELSNLNIILNYAKSSGAKIFFFLHHTTQDDIHSNYVKTYENLVCDFCKTNNVDFKILKFSYAIGEHFPNNDFRPIPSAIKDCLKNKDIFLQNDYYTRLISITDVLNSINYLMHNYVEENVINIVQNYPIAISQIIRKIILSTFSSSKLNFESFELNYDNTTISNTLPIELENLDIALEKMINYAKIKYSI